MLSKLLLSEKLEKNWLIFLKNIFLNFNRKAGDAARSGSQLSEWSGCRILQFAWTECDQFDFSL